MKKILIILICILFITSACNISKSSKNENFVDYSESVNKEDNYNKSPKGIVNIEYIDNDSSNNVESITKTQEKIIPKVNSDIEEKIIGEDDNKVIEKNKKTNNNENDNSETIDTIIDENILESNNSNTTEIIINLDENSTIINTTIINETDMNITIIDENSTVIIETCENEIAEPHEDIIDNEEIRLKIIDGEIYICENEEWIYYSSLLSESFKKFEFTKTENSCIITNTENGESDTLYNIFSNEFDEITFLDNFGNNNWDRMTLQSPEINTVKKYNTLNTQILNGGDFVDNRIDLEYDNIQSGTSSMKYYAIDPNQTVGKSLISKEKICFGKGDELWFSGWFYFDEGIPTTIVDFESRQFNEAPGIRVYIRDDKYATLELKHGNKPQYNQNLIKTPIKEWFNIKFHLTLDNQDSGIIQMWQDDVLIINTTGQTLPTVDSIYSSIQLGITATDMETTMYTDNIKLSTIKIE